MTIYLLAAGTSLWNFRQTCANIFAYDVFTLLVKIARYVLNLYQEDFFMTHSMRLR
jgi:hypothetical protein